MKKINYKSDFDFILDLKDCRGNSLGFQDYDWELLLYTLTKADGVKVSYIRKKCMNCFNDNGRIHVVLNSPRFAPGVLKAEIRIHFQDDRYPDGVKTEVTYTELDIQLVTGKCDDYTITTTSVTVPNVQQSSEDVEALKQEISNQKKLINNLRREVGYIYANGYMPVNCTNYNYIYDSHGGGDVITLKRKIKGGFETNFIEDKISLPKGLELREAIIDYSRRKSEIITFSKIKDSHNNEFLLKYNPSKIYEYKDEKNSKFIKLICYSEHYNNHGYMRIDENRELHFLKQLPEGTNRKKLVFNHDMLFKYIYMYLKYNRFTFSEDYQFQRRRVKRRRRLNSDGEYMWKKLGHRKQWTTIQRSFSSSRAFKIEPGVYRARRKNKQGRKSDWIYFRYTQNSNAPFCRVDWT